MKLKKLNVTVRNDQENQQTTTRKCLFGVKLRVDKL